MITKNQLSFVILLFISLFTCAQNNLYSSLTIPKALKEHANAVIRSNNVHVILESFDQMHVIEKRIITVLNEEGNDNIDAYTHYDDGVKIKALQAIVYNGFGKQIKKIKKNDFKDVSAVDGSTLYSDSRVKYLEYTPIQYPYTIEFTSEIVTGNTAFLPPFIPLDDYFVSIEDASYTIDYTSGMSIRKKEKNFDGITLTKEDISNKITYSVKNINAYVPEVYSPSFKTMIPKVMFALKEFVLEGVHTKVGNWDEFGKWMYQDLIKGAYDLSPVTIQKIQDLVKDETSDIDKAKKIYQYVQDKTRYISVQVGIGGWKPFNASQVDRLGYSDCKGLTNYTMSLLKAVGIESNYTVVYAGRSQRNIEKDFAAMQGNHVILNIPSENEENIWLECTNQKLPFGFIGDFTDDRDVLVITPEGGEIKHTKKYHVDENTQTITGSYQVSNAGEINAHLSVNSKGMQYDDKYWLESETDRDLDKHYKKRWKYVNNMVLNKHHIENNKKDIAFVETIDFQAANYTKMIGNRMLLTINALNRNTHIPDRYRDRKMPLQIKRGFKDIDEVEVTLPDNYSVEAMPSEVNIENKFGSYKTEIIQKDDTTLIYKREFIIKDGTFPKEDYNAFRDFYKDVSKQDNSKIALIKKQ